MTASWNETVSPRAPLTLEMLSPGSSGRQKTFSSELTKRHFKNIFLSFFFRPDPNLDPDPSRLIHSVRTATGQISGRL